MHYTLERLINGDQSVSESFANAKMLFSELFNEQRDGSVEDWAQWLTSAQMRFEMDCGGRWEGQEVMAWAGFAMLYTTMNGFDENLSTARKLLAAWQKSYTSVECKGAAEEAAKDYGVEDE